MRITVLGLLFAVATATTMRLSAADAQPPRDAAAATTVVMLGDSITKGVRAGVATEETFSALLNQRLKKAGVDARVVNLGIGGETTAGALGRFDAQVVPLRPQIVVVMYGTNDCHVDTGKTTSRLSPDEFRRNLVTLIGRIRALPAEPILMTEPCYAQRSPANGLGEHGNVRLAPFMQICREVAAQQDLVLIDNFERWTAAQQAGQAIEAWTTDGYHPNPAGHGELATALVEPVTLAVNAAQQGPVDFAVDIEEVLAHDDRKSLWYHPRAVCFPNSFTRAPVADYLVTLQKHLITSDHYDGLATLERGTRAGWSGPQAVPALAWKKDNAGATVAVCDVTPGYHEPTGKVLCIGAKILYDEQGAQLNNQPRSTEVAYAVMTLSHAGPQWTQWQFLELPADETRYFSATAGCAQWLVEPDGSILVPIYHQGPGTPAYSATVLRCAFDGTTLTVRDIGRQLDLNEERGLCEPSLARYRGKYYLTLRNDQRALIARSDDGLLYSDPQTWSWDDGTQLGSYNTQQHWLAHSDGLFLVYTSRGHDNDHIFRHRAPLLMARVDPERLQLKRASEKVVIPERGGELGNFGANPVSSAESWVTVGEGVWSDDARQRGAKGSVFVAHVRWSLPNRLRGGSGPGGFVDRLRGERD